MLIHVEIPQLLIDFFSFDDFQALCLISKKHSAIYSSERDIFAALEAAFQGNEARVAALLTKKPELLMMKRAWTDSAGGAFEPISVLQYSVWAHDADMVRTILECLLKSEPKLYQQIQVELIAQISKKLAHTISNTSIKSTTYAELIDVQPLLERARYFYDLANTTKWDVDRILDIYFTLDTLPELNACWIELGKIFRESPVHFIQSYHVVEDYFYEDVRKPCAQDLFNPESYELFNDDNKLFSYLFKLRTPRSEPFYFVWSDEYSERGNYSWFGQEKDCGLGYDIGITAPFHLNYDHGMIQDRNRRYPWLCITKMLHSVLGYSLLLKLRVEETNVLLQHLTRSREDLQSFLHTLPERSDISIFQNDLSTFFKGPTFWKTKKQTQVIVVAPNTRISTNRCCTIS